MYYYYPGTHAVCHALLHVGSGVHSSLYELLLACQRNSMQLHDLGEFYGNILRSACCWFRIAL